MTRVSTLLEARTWIGCSAARPTLPKAHCSVHPTLPARTSASDGDRLVMAASHMSQIFLRRFSETLITTMPSAATREKSD